MRPARRARRATPASATRRAGVAVPLAALLVALPALAGLAGCGDGGGDGGGRSPGDGAAGEGRPRVVNHEAGTAEVPAEAERIVALDQPAALGALSLGVEPAVVLGGFWSQPEAEEILSHHGLAPEPFQVAAPSLERVAAARPDLIIGSGHPATIQAYEQYAAIAPTVVVPFTAGWRDQLSVIAQALGRQDRADVLVARLDRRIAEVRAALADRNLAGTTVSVIGSIRGQPFAFPNSGLAGRLIADLRLARPAGQDVEVAPEQGFVTFSAERLPEHDGDVLLTVTGAVYDTAETIVRSPLYERLGAVRRDRAYEVSADMWLGAYPLAALWVVEDLEDALLHDQPPGATAVERWEAFAGR